MRAARGSRKNWLPGTLARARGARQLWKHPAWPPAGDRSHGEPLTARPPLYKYPFTMALALSLDSRHERSPRLGADTQHRAALAVLGVADQDRAGNAARLEAVRPAVAAVSGLAQDR